MKYFKLRTGNDKVYEISRYKFEELTNNREPYTMKGKDGEIRNFAVCPACDNPIQLLGMYKKLKNTDHPYGKHYNTDTPLAKHNEQAYYYCPFSGKKYQITKESRREEMTDFERKIYDSVRENFDLAIYIIRQDTGIFINNKLAEKMLGDYLAAKGYMYYWATLYNIPWMILYFSMSKPCYKMMVKKDSELYAYLATRKDVLLEMKEGSQYVIVGNNGPFLDLHYAAIHHGRTVSGYELKENIQLTLSSTGRDGLPKIQHRILLEINEYRFPNLILSEKAAQYRNQELLDIARRMMPDLD